MKSTVFTLILAVKIQANAEKLIGRHFILQIDNDLKHTTKATQELLKKKWHVLQWMNQSPDLHPIDHAFHLLKPKLKAERPTHKKLKTAAVRAKLQKGR